MADQIKVYELAKTLGVKSVVLMQKIRREWKLPVKSHMESLSPELVEQIEKKFSAEKKKVSAEKSKDKSPVKKTKKTIKKGATAVKKAKPALEIKETSLQSATPPPTPVKQIIRRKKEDQPPEAPEPSSVVSKSAESAPSPAISEGTPKASAGGIRSDLVSIRSTSPLDDSQWGGTPVEAAKKASRRPLAEKEVEVKFHAADFRKREVIFQPKKKRVITSGDVKKTQLTTPKSHKRIIKIYGEISLEDLARRMGIKKKSLAHKLSSQGVDTKTVEHLDFETVALVVPEWGFEAKNVQKTEKELLEEISPVTQDKGESQLKPPVVTIMGHVDHGKTTLLDAIRKTKVAKGEAGGITQHIGAYSVEVADRPITFIDTPGHEAFTAMRARGAQATDIVVIVVSAVDGVMPQTVEAINHAKTAETPLIVAVNKMDVEGASPDRVKQELSKHSIVPEDWGGDTAFIHLSALKGEGIKELLEQIQLVAEVQELKCYPKSSAQGMVIEASIEKGRGPVVTLLMQDGTLKVGQNVLAGQFTGRVRQMKNDQGQALKEVGPGFPVEVVGFPSLPEVGDLFCAVKDEKAARELIRTRKSQQTEDSDQALSVEDLLEKAHGEKDRELKLIVKADVSGSLEALKKSLEPIKGEGVSLQIVHSAAGGITESDVLLASTISGTILGFNVRPDGKAGKLAQDKNVEILSYSVIYELLDDVKKMMIGLLASKTEEESQGSVEVREIFHISKVGTVAGSYVTQGMVTRNSLIRVVRDGRLMHDGKISSLKRFKEDAKEVKSGFECGLTLENFNDIKPKDILEAYINKEIRPTEL